MSEKKFDAQINYGWGLTFSMSGKAPAINKRIFDTLSDAQSFADDYNDSAIEGLVLSVVADDNEKNNGIYFVERIKKSADDQPSSLIKVGSNEEELNLIKDAINDLEEKTNIFIEVTYDELKMLRDNNQLIVGKWYRIIDYETIIYNKEAYTESQSAGHLFDIIVLAIDTNKLSENAKAINSKRDTEGYFQNSNLSAWELKYSLDNDWTRFSWAVPEYDVYHLYDSDGNYLDNNRYSSLFLISSEDTKIEGYPYKFLFRLYDTYNTILYTSSLNIKEGEYGYIENLFGYPVETPLSNHKFIKSESQIRGKGIIYEMKDEFNNKCFYDFKNIQFKRYKIKSTKEDASKDDFRFYEDYLLTNVDPELPSGYESDDEDYKYFYTFSVIINNNIKDSSLGIFIDENVEDGLNYGGDSIKSVRHNIINSLNFQTDEAIGLFNNCFYILNNNVFISNFDYQDNISTFLIQNNTININCDSNTFLGPLKNNILNSNSSGNIISDSNSNNIGCEFHRNWLLSSDNNNIFNDCHRNNFSEITGNTFGNNCGSNNIKNCNYNSFGNDLLNVKMELCNYNTLGNRVNNIKIGKESHHNTIYDGVNQNINSGTTYQQIFHNQ